MLERNIEQALVRHVHHAGGLCLKLHATTLAGIPDRLILLPDGKVCFVETKAPGKKPRPIQTRRHQQLAALGHAVRTLDNTHAIPDLIQEIQNQ